MGSGVRARPHGHDEIAGGSRADILDSMLIVRMNKTHTAWTQTIAGSVDREFDRAFTNEPHLRVRVTVWSVRRGAGRQHGLMYLQRLTGSQLALEDAAHFGVVESLHGQLVKRIISRAQGSAC